MTTLTLPWSEPPARLQGVRPEDLTALLVYRSSAEVGWEGGKDSGIDSGIDGALSASASLVPRELESHTVAADPNIVLGLYAGGGLHIERREGPGSWVGGEVHHGDLKLIWPGGAAYEARVWALSARPSWLLNLRLGRTLLARAAEEVVGVEWARLELVGRAGFQDPLLAELAFALWRELEQPAPAGRLYAEAAAWLLAVHLVRRYAIAPGDHGGAPAPIALPAPAGLSERRLDHALEYIHAHLGEDLTLEAVARQVGYSPYHFARLFRRATGESLHQLVLRERIARARRLLTETDLPLARVAGECGFAHQSHLTRVFRQELGHTPRAERREGWGAGWGEGSS
jgi:AraC family transcriptional regulator